MGVGVGNIRNEGVGLGVNLVSLLLGVLLLFGVT